MPVTIDDNGSIQAIRDKLTRWPDKMRDVLTTTMNAALMAVWGSVPGYPEQRANSDYVRTGTLGRTLGVSEDGGMNGKPDIYEVRELNGGFYEARFGTNLGYAPYVIGEHQAWMHQPFWWTIRDVAEAATPKVQAIFQKAKDEVIAWFNSGS